MLNEKQIAAARRWYSQDGILEKVRALQQAGAWEELEDYLHRDCLMPLGRHAALPDWMRDDTGAPLFPDNLNPAANLEAWQDAIEVGWRVVEERLGLTRDEVHIKIRDAQNADWGAFLKRRKQS